MSSLLLLPILLVFQPSPQNPSTAHETSPVVAISFRWFKDRQAAEKVVVPARGPQPSMIEPNNNIAREARTDGTKPVRDPNLEKLETRSASLDELAQQSNETPRVEGFTYEVTFKNLNAKQAQTVFWEYHFKETATPENTSRHRFVCSVRMKPEKEKVVQVFSTLSPGAVISLKDLAKGSGKQFDESVVIDRIEFDDGSVWQRKDWNFEEAKSAVTNGDNRSRMCRSF
jgi:hypothetical protein